MTTATNTSTGEPARVLSPRTRRTYAADWAPFTDWCGAADTTALPADPQTVVDFLTECPAAPTTLRCRVAAVDHHHTTAGLPRPGESVAARAALAGPPANACIRRKRERTLASDGRETEAALRGPPSHGWTQGMFGRRDRCLAVLSQLAGVPPYRHLATLTASGLHLAAGVATVRSAAGE